MDTTEKHVRSEAEARIIRAFGAMPYGGGLAFRQPRTGEPLTFEHVAANLEALRDRLIEVARKDQDETSELYRLRADVAAVRRVFGIGE